MIDSYFDNFFNVSKTSVCQNPQKSLLSFLSVSCRFFPNFSGLTQQKCSLFFKPEKKNKPKNARKMEEGKNNCRDSFFFLFVECIVLLFQMLNEFICCS